MAWSEDSNLVKSNGTTAVEVVPAPEFNDKREVFSMTIANRDGSAITAQVFIKKDTTSYMIAETGSLAAGSVWTMPKELRPVLKAIDESVEVKLTGSPSTQADISASWGAIGG